MATPYAEIYNQFLASVHDFDLLKVDQETAELQLYRFLQRAVGTSRDMFMNCSQIDLLKQDKEKKEFEDDLTYEEIEVLVAGMEYFWCMYMVHNTELAYIPLTTRDISFIGPQNVLFRWGEEATKAEDRWDRAQRRYAQRHIDISTMNGLITND